MTRLAALFAVAAALSMTTSLARAGCEKDTDCKGDRICENERCVDPEDAGGSPGLVQVPPDVLEQAATHHRKARAHTAGAWILGGLGILDGAIIIGVSIADEAEEGMVGGNALLATALLGAGIPVGSAANRQARKGLGLLGLEGTGHHARSAAWVFYAVTLTFGVAAGALTFAEVEGVGYGLGGGAIAMGITALTLMTVDAKVNNAALGAALDTLSAQSRAAPRHRPPTLTLGPWFSPGSDGDPERRVGLACAGTW